MKQVLSSILLTALLLPAAALGQADQAAARAAFERGSELSDAGRFAEAIEAFRESRRHNPGNASPLFAIGVCQMELGEAHYEEALATLDQYVTEGHNPERHEQAQRRIRTLLVALRLGTLRILAVPDAVTVTIDGDTVPPDRYGQIRLAVGSHTVVAAGAGRDDDSRQVSIVAGEVAQLSFSTPAPGAPQPPEPAAQPEPETSQEPGEPSPPVEPAQEAAEPPTTPPSAGPVGEPESEPESDAAPPEDVSHDDSGGLPSTEEQPPRRRAHQQWWFWTLIGAVVLGGVTAGVVVGTRNPDPPAGDWRVEVP